jgi:hypothetical protein
MKKLCSIVLLLAWNLVWAEALLFSLSVKDGLVSAQIEQTPLGKVLKELARQAQLKVQFEAALGNEVISARLENLPLEEAIKRLLGDKSYSLRYGQPDSSAAPRPVEILVLAGKGSIPNTSAPPPAQIALSVSSEAKAEKSLEDLSQQALHASDPTARIVALQQLVRRGYQNRALLSSTVSSALRDTDVEVRGEAMRLAQTQALPMEQALQDMARRDSSTELRAAAWDQLFDLSENPAVARERMEQALQDPDPQIRAWAQDKLEQLANQQAEQQ